MKVIVDVFALTEITSDDYEDSLKLLQSGDEWYACRVQRYPMRFKRIARVMNCHDIINGVVDWPYKFKIRGFYAKQSEVFKIQQNFFAELEFEQRGG